VQEVKEEKWAGSWQEEKQQFDENPSLININVHLSYITS